MHAPYDLLAGALTILPNRRVEIHGQALYSLTANCYGFADLVRLAMSFSMTGLNPCMLHVLANNTLQAWPFPFANPTWQIS